MPRELTEDWASYLWYEAVFWASMTGTTLGFSLRTDGVGNVPRSGPALLIANHQSFLDPMLVGLAARRHLWYLARRTLFHSRTFTWLIRSLNAVAIDQDGVALEGLRTTLEELESGRAVVVFPEGERTVDGALHELRPGVHLLIKRAQCPVVPIGIAGAYDAWPRWRLLPVPAPLCWPAGKGTLAVSVGKPLPGAELAKLPRAELLARLRGELQAVVDRAERLRRKDAPLNRTLAPPTGGASPIHSHANITAPGSPR
jgi:1-acyl-sn-glycerol-3-phosphate acyltransferase